MYVEGDRKADVILVMAPFALRVTSRSFQAGTAWYPRLEGFGFNMHNHRYVHIIFFFNQVNSSDMSTVVHENHAYESSVNDRQEKHAASDTESYILSTNKNGGDPEKHQSDQGNDSRQISIVSDDVSVTDIPHGRSTKIHTSASSNQPKLFLCV